VIGIRQTSTAAQSLNLKPRNNNYPDIRVEKNKQQAWQPQQ